MFKKWLIDSIYYFVKDTSISVVRNFFLFFRADFFLKSLSFKAFRRFFSATYLMFDGGSISVR